MTKSINTIKQPRIQLLEMIKGLSIEQLNKVPAGFNNNIIWNLGHMVAAQQGICYARAGLDKIISEDFFMAYRPGTKPEKFIDDAEVENIKALMLSTLDQLEIDFQKNIFINMVPWTTRYGVDISNIDDAISFLPFHEGLHIGCIIALKKLI